MLQFIRSMLRFAFSRLGKRDSLWVQLPTLVVGGVTFSYWGIKMPQSISDNLPLSGIAGLLFGLVGGSVFLFIVLCCYYPVHIKYESRGGLANAIGQKLGAFMIPIIMMISGTALFVLIFGSGVIWFAVIEAKRGLERSPANLSAPQQLAFELSLLEAKVRYFDERATTFENYQKEYVFGLDSMIKQLTDPKAYYDYRGPILAAPNNAQIMDGMAKEDLGHSFPKFGLPDDGRYINQPVAGEKPDIKESERIEIRREQYKMNWQKQQSVILVGEYKNKLSSMKLALQELSRKAFSNQ